MNDIKIYSNEITKAVQLSIEAGNKVMEISSDWEKVRQVIHMQKPLSAELKDKIISSLKLRYWKSFGTPHNRADEGFTDDIEKASISFPAL
jgi:hypothetical protein